MRETWRHIILAVNVLWWHSKGKNCELVLQQEWFYEWSHDECIQFSTVLKPSDRLDLYIASLMVSCSWEAILTSQTASVLLKNPCAHIDFIHRALVVACIHGCCSWNIVQHIVNDTWSPWTSVAVRIMSLLNARDFILINPLIWCLLFPLFSLDVKHKDPSFQDCHRSLPNFQTQ